MDFQIRFNGYRIELEDVSSKSQQISLYRVGCCCFHPITRITRCKIYWPMSSLRDGVRHQFERDIDITKAIKGRLSRYQDVLYDAIQVSLSRRFALTLTPNGKLILRGLIDGVNNR